MTDLTQRLRSLASGRSPMPMDEAKAILTASADALDVAARQLAAKEAEIAALADDNARALQTITALSDENARLRKALREIADLPHESLIWRDIAKEAKCASVICALGYDCPDGPHGGCCGEPKEFTPEPINMEEIAAAFAQIRAATNNAALEFSNLQKMQNARPEGAWQEGDVIADPTTSEPTHRYEGGKWVAIAGKE